MADEELKELIRELIQWQRFSSWDNLKEVLTDVLDASKDVKQDAKKLAYEMSDGSNSKTEIAKSIPYTRHAVGNWHDEWEGLGLVRENDEGNAEHLISLEKLGIDVPDAPVEEK